MNWKILEIFAKDELITGVKYYLCSDGDYFIETEGHFYFNEPTIKVPFSEVTEEMIIEWLEKEAVIDGKNHIEDGIEKQIETLKSNKKTPAPWLPQVFKPEI